MKNSPVIILHTCDAYQKYWDPWFYYFNKNVKTDYPIYFLSETIEPKFKDRVNIILSGKGPWSDRLMFGLNQIDGDYIFYTQEDFWGLNELILDGRYFELFKKYSMDALRIIPPSNLYSTTHIKDNNFSNLFKFNQKSGYLMTHQFSLWDKNFLMKFLPKSNNPQQNEIEQSKVISNLDHKIYMIQSNWYDSTVRGGKLNPVGLKLYEEFKKNVNYD
jgi:hypothetical protein